MLCKERVDVSPEMIAYVGAGVVPESCLLEQPIAVRFDGLRQAAPTFKVDPSAASQSTEDADLLLLVTSAACTRIFGFVPAIAARWHLPSDLRALVLAICECKGDEPARTTLRLAKSIELLCEVYTHLQNATLVPASGRGALSENDAQRIAHARQMIDENWSQRLTIDSIAKGCGLSRAKLTRSFKQAYDCTITDALITKRLAGAQQLLRATDLPVSAIGHRCGYLNNASFTRAFSRHVGLAPTQFRISGGLT